CAGARQTWAALEQVSALRFVLMSFQRHALLRAGLAGLLLAMTACASAASAGRQNSATNLSQPFSQSCLGAPAETGHPAIAWDRLRNPVLSYANSAVRDIGIRLRAGKWHL